MGGGSNSDFIWRKCLFPSLPFFSLSVITNAPKQTTPKLWGIKPPFFYLGFSGNGWTLVCVGAGKSGGIFTHELGGWHGLSAGTPTHGPSMWSLHMGYSGPPHSMVAGFQETVPQESRANTHGIFMVLPQMSDSVTNFCQALLGETITKVCPGSRGGMCGEDSQGHGVRWACGMGEFCSHSWKMQFATTTDKRTPQTWQVQKSGSQASLTIADLKQTL